MTVCKKKIQDRVSELSKVLDNATDAEIKQSGYDAIRMGLLLDELSVAEVNDKPELLEEFSTLDLTLNNAKIEMYQLLETLKHDLMHVSTRYVVTNSNDLTSPAGYHPDEKVFLQTGIAIHTDSLDNLPNCDQKLYSFEINPPTS
jgi:hypothetical protein